MKLFFVCCLSGMVIFFISCVYSDQKILFHDRVILGMNGVSTYLDYLRIENYREGSFTAKQLCDIANQYVDTVQTDLIVKGVVFLRQKSFHKLPENMFDVSSERMHKLSIIEFSFVKDTARSISNSVNRNMKLQTVTVFKNDEHETYYNTNVQDKIVIDSILASKERCTN